MPISKTAVQQLLFDATTETLKRDATRFEIMSLSQELRSRLSAQAFVLVFIVAIVYTWGLWGRSLNGHLLLWSVAVSLTAAHRAWYCRTLLRDLHRATAEQLIRHEFYLFINGIIYGIFIGAAFWLIAAQGDIRTTFAITLMSCMYAIGTTVNSSVHFRTFFIFTLLNLGQGIAFFAIAPLKTDIPIMTTMIVILILLLRFGHRNAELFEKSVVRRLENVAQNIQLKKNQTDIEHSLQIANEANLSKSRFLAATSHDLRQPLHALSLFLGTLKNTETTSEQDRLLEYIQQSTDTLTMQFNSLLDLSRYDSGYITKNVVSFDLHTILTRLVNSMSLEAKEKNLNLTYVGESVVLQSDPLLLDRVMRNLVTNALKYTDNGSIHISNYQKNEQVIVSVSDTGCGIAEADQLGIFEEFTQLDNPERQKGKGAGLGLAIVKRIATLLDIEVTIESRVGHGSTFTLYIPLIISDAHSAQSQGAKKQEESPQSLHTSVQQSESENPDEPTHITSASTIESLDGKFDSISKKYQSRSPSEASRESSPSLSLTGINVLLVDDDPTILQAFSQLIKHRGGSVTECTSHSESVQIETPTNTDFAFIDDMLSGNGSGLDIANWLSGYIDKQRIIIVTGSEDPHRMQEIRSAGFSVYTKPLTSNQLDSIFLSRASLFNDATLQAFE